MNKAIKTVATLMIVVLIVTLIWIFLSYYSGDGVIDVFGNGDRNSNISISNIPSGDYMVSDDTKKGDEESLIDSIMKTTGIEAHEEKSGDRTPEVIETPPEKNDNNVREEPNQFVISSDPQTSNKEKKEVLDEIDKALHGLLEAVGKVEIVDEARLDSTLDSEVDKP